jgi:hypothetical protein
MKEKADQNPIRWLMYIGLFWLLFDIMQIYLDATVTGIGEVWGIPFDSRGPLNPIAPFRIGCIVVFLYFYVKRSKHAWIAIMIPMVLSTPAYWILRMQRIYFRAPKSAVNDYLALAAWVGLLLYTISLRTKYLSFIASDKGRQDGCSEK